MTPAGKGVHMTARKFSAKKRAIEKEFTTNFIDEAAAGAERDVNPVLARVLRQAAQTEREVAGLREQLTTASIVLEQAYDALISRGASDFSPVLLHIKDTYSKIKRHYAGSATESGEVK